MDSESAGDATWRPSACAQIFASDSFSGVLEAILLELPLKEALRCCRVSKHINEVITSSAHIQLALRVSHLGLPPLDDSARSRSASQSYATVLTRLLEREEGLCNLTPKETLRLRLNQMKILDVQDGFLLIVPFKTGVTSKFDRHWVIMERSSNPTPRPANPGSGGELQFKRTRTCRVNLPPTEWRTEALAFCPKDQVVAVSQSSTAEWNHSRSALVYAIRIYFYEMCPSNGSGMLAEDCVARPHPAAALPFIELRIHSTVPGDEGKHARVLDMQIAPGGRMIVRTFVPNDEMGSCPTVWDWKKGVALGRVSPSGSCCEIFDSRFLTPHWLVCPAIHVLSCDACEAYGLDHGEAGLLIGIDVFDLATSSRGGIPPTNTCLGDFASSPPCAWLYDELPEAISLCVLLLSPLLAGELVNISEPGARLPVFIPSRCKVECPLVTSLAEHMPGILTLMVMGNHGDSVASINAGRGISVVLHATVPVRVLMAAALAGAFRQHARREGLRSLSLSANDCAFPCGPIVLTWTSIWQYFDLRCDALPTLPKPFGWRNLCMASCNGHCLLPELRRSPTEALDVLPLPPLGLSLTDYHPSKTGFQITRERPIGSLTRSSSGSSPLQEVEHSEARDRPAASRPMPPDWQMCGDIRHTVAERTAEHPFVFRHRHAHCRLKFARINAHVFREKDDAESELFYDGENLVLVKDAQVTIYTF